MTLCSQAEARPPSREHRLAQVPRGTPVAFAPKPIAARAAHALISELEPSSGEREQHT